MIPMTRNHRTLAGPCSSGTCASRRLHNQEQNGGELSLWGSPEHRAHTGKDVNYGKSHTDPPRQR